MSQPTTSPAVAATAFDPHNIPVAVNTPIVPIAGEPPVSVVITGLVVGLVLKVSVVLFIIFLMYVNNWNLLNWWT
jgi:hypothetical protein